MTLQDHMIKGPCDIMEGSSLLNIPTLSSLVAMGIVVVDMTLVCHVLLQDHVIIWSCDFMSRSCSR